MQKVVSQRCMPATARYRRSVCPTFARVALPGPEHPAAAIAAARRAGWPRRSLRGSLPSRRPHPCCGRAARYRSPHRRPDEDRNQQRRKQQQRTTHQHSPARPLVQAGTHPTRSWAGERRSVGSPLPLRATARLRDVASGHQRGSGGERRRRRIRVRGRGAFESEVGEERWRRFRSTMRRVIDGRISIEHRMAEQRGHYPPGERRTPLTVSIDNDASDFFTVIEVGASDQVGLPLRHHAHAVGAGTRRASGEGRHVHGPHNERVVRARCVGPQGDRA